MGGFRDRGIKILCSSLIGLGICAAVSDAIPRTVPPSSLEFAEPQTPTVSPVCQAVVDVLHKLISTPYHSYMVETLNGKTSNAETIFVGDTYYVQINGKWTVSPISAQDMKEMGQRNMKNAKNLSCQEVRDEAVNGESATVYTSHSVTERGTADTQMWISKSRALLLRQDIDSAGTSFKNHSSTRFEYGNVKAPSM
jgi:hypothetical protein